MDSHQLKKDFPILARSVHGHPLVYLDNAATTQKPRQVIDAITNYYTNHNANVHRGIHTLGDESTHLYHQSRARIAKFIHSPDPDEIIFTRNTTEGLNLIAFTWGQQHITKGDELIITELEHHSNILVWQRLARLKGAKLLYLPIDNNGDLVISQLKNLISPRTKVVALTHISNGLGNSIDIQHLIKQIHTLGHHPTIILDAAQSIPHQPIRVTDLGVDWLVFSGHKMCGPMGIGVVWGKKKLLAQLDPFILGGGMIDQVSKYQATWAPLPDRFDAGTPNVAGAVGLAAACDYLDAIGLEHISTHQTQLITYALEQCAPLVKQGILTLYGSTDPAKRGGILTFNITNVHAHDVAQILDRQFGIAIRSGHHCNQILINHLGVPATCRASFYIYNTTSDIDLLIKGILHIYHMFHPKK